MVRPLQQYSGRVSSMKLYQSDLLGFGNKIPCIITWKMNSNGIPSILGIKCIVNVESVATLKLNTKLL